MVAVVGNGGAAFSWGGGTDLGEGLEGRTKDALGAKGERVRRRRRRRRKESEEEEEVDSLVVVEEKKRRGGVSLFPCPCTPRAVSSSASEVQVHARPFPEMCLGSRVDTVDLGLAA